MRQLTGAMDGLDGGRATDPNTVDDLTARIYRVVGESLGTDPRSEPIPIRDAIDPEALVRAFNDNSGETYVSFPIEDRRVTVHSDGEVIVHPE